MASKEEELKKGARVEVNFEESGFRGSWYAGTVVRPVGKKKKKKKMLVELETLLDERHRRLREQVNFLCVRPAPPRESSRSFRLNEDVDAFHKDGWWEGVVTALHPPSHYSVFFRSTREQIRFPESDLRLHREWVRGTWVPPPPAAPEV